MLDPMVSSWDSMHGHIFKLQCDTFTLNIKKNANDTLYFLTKQNNIIRIDKNKYKMYMTSHQKKIINTINKTSNIFHPLPNAQPITHHKRNVTDTLFDILFLILFFYDWLIFFFLKITIFCDHHFTYNDSLDLKQDLPKLIIFNKFQLIIDKMLRPPFQNISRFRKGKKLFQNISRFTKSILKYIFFKITLNQYFMH